jgi:hypothetical protein
MKNLLEIYCFSCGITKQELSKTVLTKKSICKKCNNCIKCSKNKEILCTECCSQCKQCEKILSKRSWPTEIIISGRCNNCAHLCRKCQKYVTDQKAIFKGQFRYCSNCFIEKYTPKNEKIKYKIIITKKGDRSVFLEWQPEYEKIDCSKCECSVWKNIKNKSTICKKCSTKNKTKVAKDPSDNNHKYFLEDGIWTIEKLRTRCISCLDSIWITPSELKIKRIYYCKSCMKNNEICQKIEYL